MNPLEQQGIPPTDETATGLPVLRTWPSVYVFVLAIFVVWVGLLAALPMMFP